MEKESNVISLDNQPQKSRVGEDNFKDENVYYSVSDTGLIRPRHSKILAMARGVDVFVIFATFYLISSTLPVSISTTACFIFIAVYVATTEYFELYSLWRGNPISRELKRVIAGWLLSSITCLLFVSFFTNQTLFHHVYWLWICLPTLCCVHVLRRYTLSKVRSLRHNRRKYAIVAANQYGYRLHKAIKSMNWLGLDFMGFYDDRKPTDQRLDARNIEELVGDIDQLIADVYAHKITEVYICYPLSGEHRSKQLLAALSDTTASVYLVPDFNSFDPLHARWSTVQGLPIISLYDSPFESWDALVKRAEDITLATAILMVISVPMLLIAALVKLTSPGPVIFKQQRYGVDGEPIEVWKFRSMTVCENDSSEIKQAIEGDKRVTKLGGFLRKTSLDELPQFINVLQGTMSIVGPRPHAIAHNEIYRKKIHGYMLRHKIKPGITGWAQINGFRGETNTDDKMGMRIKYDLDYINYWSVFLDLKIITLSIFKGFISKKAY